MYYFSGRSDNFDGLQLSTDPSDARLDPESVRVGPKDKELFVSDEYGPYIYRFDRNSGKRTDVIALPDKFAIASLFAVGDDELPTPNDELGVGNWAFGVFILHLFP